MKFSAEIISLVIASLILHIFAQCQQTCIPNSLEKDYKCSDIVNSRPFEVKQPGRCSKQNSEARNAICCPSNDAWVKNNVIRSSVDESVAYSRGALPDEFPHQVYIQRTKGTKINRCSGTVYNQHYIITSASCINEKNEAEKVVVIAGATNPTGSLKANTYEVTDVFPHPRYNAKQLRDGSGYDISILKLEMPLDFESGKIKPLRIAPKDFVPDYNEEGIVLDWTNKAPSKGAQSRMIKSFAQIYDQDACQRIFGEDERFYNGMNHQLCVAGGSSGINVFEGDSAGGGGGPLICPDLNNNRRPVLCGVASYKPCTNCASPAIFTRISSLVDWIRKITKNEPQESQHFLDENIDGEAGEPEDFLVRIFGKEKTCDGTLLSSNLVVTAKNCIFKTKDLDSIVIIHAKSKVRLVHSHKVDTTYSSYYSEIGNTNSTNVLRDSIRKYDIAFFELKEHFKINFYPLIPPDHYELIDAVEMSYSLKSNNLELRNYRFVDKSICQPRYDLLKVKLTNEMFCAAENYSGGSTCQRSLGSPLICEGKYLCGIASSRGCSFAFPNIYTDTAEINDFIEQQIHKSEPESDHH